MKKPSLKILLLLSLTITISCKKEAKETKEAIKKIETISVTSETNSTTTQDSTVTDFITVDTIPKKTAEGKLVSETIRKTKNKVTDKTTSNETSVVKKTEEIAANGIEKTVETIKEETEIVVEEPQKEIMGEAVEPIKEVPKQQLTKSEKITLGKTLFTNGICKNCHHQTKKMIGPTLVTIGSVYKKKNGSIAAFLKGNGKPIVEPKRFKMMKPNIDDVTRHMSTQDIEALEAYILSFTK